MNKTDLVARVSVDAGISKREAADAVHSALHAIQSTVAKGERVTLPGFGTFERRQRAARTARNPRTGEAVRVAPTTVPSFKPGVDFKEAVQGTRRRRTARSSKAKRRR